MCAFLSAYTSSLCVGGQCFMRGEEMSLNYESSAAQRSSQKWGTGRLYDTIRGHSGCVLCVL